MIRPYALFVLVGVLATHAALATTVTFTSTDGKTTLSADIPNGGPTFFIPGVGLEYYLPSFLFNGLLTSGSISFYNPNVNNPALPKGFDFQILESLTNEAFNFSGDQLYAGLESSPVYPSTTTSVKGLGDNAMDGTVSIFDVPEPSSLALFGTALALGCATQRRRA